MEHYRKFLKKSLFVLAYLVSLRIIFLLIIGFPDYNFPNYTPQTISSYSIVRENSELPFRLIIPKINVYSVLEHVGLEPDKKTMSAPKSPTNAAWFSIGPRPGEIGSSVINGHFGWSGGVSGAFDNIHKLRKGDMIYVEYGKGVVISFVVREIKSYDQKANTSSVFTSDDGKAHLNLITCEGSWDNNDQSYSNRLVVFADEVV